MSNNEINDRIYELTMDPTVYNSNSQIHQSQQSSQFQNNQQQYTQLLQENQNLHLQNQQLHQENQQLKERQILNYQNLEKINIILMRITSSNNKNLDINHENFNFLKKNQLIYTNTENQKPFIIFHFQCNQNNFKNLSKDLFKFSFNLYKKDIIKPFFNIEKNDNCTIYHPIFINLHREVDFFLDIQEIKSNDPNFTQLAPIQRIPHMNLFKDMMIYPHNCMGLALLKFTDLQMVPTSFNNLHEANQWFSKNFAIAGKGLTYDIYFWPLINNSKKYDYHWASMVFMEDQSIRYIEKVGDGPLLVWNKKEFLLKAVEKRNYGQCLIGSL